MGRYSCGPISNQRYPAHSLSITAHQLQETLNSGVTLRDASLFFSAIYNNYKDQEEGSSYASLSVRFFSHFSTFLKCSEVCDRRTLLWPDSPEVIGQPLSEGDGVFFAAEEL